jgi:hypothetical protein
VRRTAQKAGMRRVNSFLLDEQKRALATFLVNLTKMESAWKHLLSLISFATFLYQERKVD